VQGLNADTIDRFEEDLFGADRFSLGPDGAVTA